MSNHPEAFKYKITILPDGGEPYTVQDYSDETVFAFPLNGTGTIRLDILDPQTGKSEELNLPYKP